MASIRQNYDATSEAGINKQINLALYAEYVYLSKSYHFDRDDVALANFTAYFRQRSQSKRADADKLMDYQNKRGGRIRLQDVKKPDRDEWTSGSDAMQAALQLEKNSHDSYMALSSIAETNKDANMCDFVEEFLDANVNIIKEVSDHVSRLQKVGPGLGEYMFDRNTLKSS